MMERAIKFMWEAFKNLKICKTLAQMGQLDAYPSPTTVGNRISIPTTMTSTSASPMVAAATIPALQDQPWGKESSQEIPLGVKFNSDLQKLGSSLAQV